MEHAKRCAAIASAKLEAEGIPDVPLFSLSGNGHHSTLRELPEDLDGLLLKGSISPLPLHKALVLIDTLEEHQDSRFSDHERLALAKALVFSVSNLHFGPEVGVGKQSPMHR
jgi:hypothetical protein